MPAALDALPAFIYVKDREGRVVSTNVAFCRALNVSREDLIGKRTEPFLGEEGPASEQVDREVMESGAPRLGIVEKYTAADGVHWVLTDKSPIKDDTGATIGLVGITVDITSRKQVEDALSLSESRLRFLTDNTADIIWTTDMQLQTTFISPSVERVLGFTPEEWLPLRIEQMATPESVGRMLEALQQQLALEATGTADPNRTVTLELEYYRKSGTTLWLEQVIRALRDASGKLIGLVGVSRDITERRKTSESLRQSEARLRFLTDNMADMLWTMDLSLRTTYISPSIERLLGFTPEEWMAKRVEEMAAPESVRRIYSELQRQLALEASGTADSNRTLTLEVEFVHKNGSTLWIEQVIRALRDDAGVLIGMIGVSRDISARKRAEEALARSEAQLRVLADHMADMLWTMDLGFHTTYVSPSIERVLGFTPEERKRHSLTEMVTPDSASRIVAALQHELELEATGTADPNRSLVIDVEYYHKDGSTSWFENVVTAVRDSESRLVGLLGVSRDISERKQADEALRSSEERYRQLFGMSIAPISLIAQDGRLIEANDAWFRLVGYSREDAATFNAANLFPEPGDREEFVQNLLRAGHLDHHESQVRRKDGTLIDVVRSISVRYHPDGSVLGFQTVLLDVTEKNRAEKALRESERNYRELFEQSLDAINLVGPDGSIIEANPAWFRLFGYAPDDVGSFNARDAYVDPTGRATFLKAIAEQDHVEDELQFRRKDGSVFDCHRTVIVRRDPDGRAIGFQTVFHDITEQKRAQRALEESEEKYRALFELSKDATGLVSREGTFLEANQAMLDLFGCTREELARMPARDIYEDPTVRDREFLPRMDRDGEIVDWEVRLKKRDGTVMDCLCNVVTRKDASGAAIAFQSLIRDITAQRRSQQALRESEDKYRRLFDMSIAPISLLAPDGRMIEANDAWFELFGYSREDMDSFRAWDIYPSREARDESARRLVEHGMLLDDEALVKTKDGTFIDVMRSMVVQYNPDGSILGYQTVWRDITEQKRSQQALRESEDKYRRLFDQSVAPVSLAAPDGHIIEANDAWLQLFGYTREELPGLTTYVLYDDPKDRDNTIQRTLEAGQLVDDASRHKKKDGSYIDVLRSVSILRDSEGKVTGYQAVYRDVTELKRAQDEVLRSRELLRELAVRMQQVLERERTTVAHDLHDRVTQGLTAIKLDLDALKRRLGSVDPGVLEKLQQSIDMVEGLTSTSRDIMTELRPGMLDDLGLSAAIDWQLDQFSQRTGIRCKAALLQDDSALSPVHATALFRVLQELLGNVARHAQASEVRVSLESSDDCVVLTVRDNGRGIADKELASADSLGLLGIQERVRALGGEFSIGRGAGKQGTVARIKLPTSSPGHCAA